MKELHAITTTKRSYMQPLNVTPHSPDFQNNTAANQSLTSLPLETTLANKDNERLADDAVPTGTSDSTGSSEERDESLKVNTFRFFRKF